LKSLKYDGLDLAYCHADHLISLAEVLLLDAYHSNLLSKGDIVIDLGAGIGDFSILASRKVGSTGKVIALEPNIEDYEILKMNIERNSCTNVVALNMGVAEKPGKKEINFWNRRYSFMADTLENTLARLAVKKINFMKMDIEGFETEVIRNSIGIIEQADVVSIELHGTKEEIDRMLRPRQFTFKPVSSWHICRNFISNMLAHPRSTFEVLLFAEGAYPEIIRLRMNETRRNDHLLTGIYVRSAARAVVIR
jgi:FkbM family methyltransferase